MKERAYPVYTVNKHAEGLLVGGHPWVYENDILHSPENEPENGTLADVVSTKGSYLGTGFVSLKSKIRVRLISRNANDTFDAAFWRRRVEYAWNYRKTVLEPADLSACRVIFGEADQFPGLTVERFSNILVTQTLSVGMEKLKPVSHCTHNYYSQEMERKSNSYASWITCICGIWIYVFTDVYECDQINTKC